MSDIFDAFQRSEAERSGVDLSGPTTVTDLLRSAERRAASKWERTALAEPTAPPAGNETDPPPETGDWESQIPAPATPSAAFGEAGHRFKELTASLSVPNRIVSLDDKESPGAEAFRLLGVRLRDLRRTRSVKKLLITSTIPQEGKSMISANLACTLGLESTQKTLLLEGDVRRPSLAAKFGLERSPGLTECLQGDQGVEASIYRLNGAGIFLLPAGSATNHPLELLQLKRLSRLMDQITEWFDWIVIDSPPVLPLADTSIWMRMSDGILLVTRNGATKKRQLEKGIEALDTKKFIGGILNCSKGSTYGDYYYYRREKE